ncbi:hypothetical protein OROGR_005901 [Orobanche gracilis]
MKLPWEDRMKTAHDQGRLVLVQNLDPGYTSGEVEILMYDVCFEFVLDIVWHALKEECTAKMVQHTAISNPYSGQAFAIFKTREAVDGVVKKLDVGCLMLPNQRPLVVRTVDFPKFLEKQTNFVGHLAIDKARRQMQRDMVYTLNGVPNPNVAISGEQRKYYKEAVATSHYSQNNTVEYEMAMTWCLLQLKSDKWWKALFELATKKRDEETCGQSQVEVTIFGVFFYSTGMIILAVILKPTILTGSFHVHTIRGNLLFSAGLRDMIADVVSISREGIDVLGLLCLCICSSIETVC